MLVSTHDVVVYELLPASWSAGGTATLVDADGRCAAVLSELASRPPAIVIDRPGRHGACVRPAMSPAGAGRWGVYVAGSLAMTMLGDMRADRAILQRDDRVVADVAAHGRREYEVRCGQDTDAALVLSIVLAIDGLRD